MEGVASIMVQIQLGKISDTEEMLFNYEPKKTLATHVFGITGSRKTSLQLEMIKKFKQQQPTPQIVIFSREGDELALRNDFDLILIGQDGEVPIEIKLAKMMGENTRKQHLDVIIDLSSIKTEKEQDEFLANFLDGLMMDGQRHFWKKPCVVMIDEVQLFCNSSSSKSRDAIVRLVTLCRKRSIIPIFGSHQLKDFYWKARNDVGNVIIGYLKDPKQREAACELLKIPISEADTIAGFKDEPKGRFYAEGFDMASPAKVFILENKPYPESEEIPKISLEGLDKAKTFLHSLQPKDQLSVESQLRFELAETRNLADKLALTQD